MINNLETLVRHCKETGFIYSGSDIYGGFQNSYTYGPLGVELKNNIKQLWWKMFVHSRKDIIGIDGDIILHPKVWKTSGHIDNFSDQMVDCKDCKARLRADHLVEEALKIDCEGLTNDAVTTLIRENNIVCPKCKSKNLTDVRQFNLMFQVDMSKFGDDNKAYLRPETAQAIFIEFGNIVATQRVKLPFGIAQQGKAFRNEITPGNFIFRRLEFEQMEIEYFINPEVDNWEDIFTNLLDLQKQFCCKIGLTDDNMRYLEHAQEKLSHYSKRTVDIEYRFPMGFKELTGCAYRTDYDLEQHSKESGKDLSMMDTRTNTKLIPHVIEPSFGTDRAILAALIEAYTEEILENDTRIVLKLPYAIAPYKCAILPLMKKDGMSEYADDVYTKLSHIAHMTYDDGGSIGKRYRRQDEIGTPYCITIDYDTLSDGTMTVRDRDTMLQTRMNIDEIESMLYDNNN